MTLGGGKINLMKGDDVKNEGLGCSLWALLGCGETSHLIITTLRAVWGSGSY